MKRRAYLCVFLIACAACLACFAEEKEPVYAVVSITDTYGTKIYEVIDTATLKDKKKEVKEEADEIKKEWKEETTQWKKDHPRHKYPLKKPRFKSPQVKIVKGGFKDEDKASEELDKIEEREDHYLILYVIVHTRAKGYDVQDHTSVNDYRQKLERKYVAAYEEWVKEQEEIKKDPKKFATAKLKRQPTLPMVKPMGKKYKDRLDAAAAMKKMGRKIRIPR